MFSSFAVSYGLIISPRCYKIMSSFRNIYKQFAKNLFLALGFIRKFDNSYDT